MLSTPQSNGRWLLYSSLLVVLYLVFRIIQPFLMPIVLALVFASLLTPTFERLSARLRGRRTLAASLICIAFTIAILVPGLLLSIALAHEANDVYQYLKDPAHSQAIATWMDPALNPWLSRLRGWLPESLATENLGIEQITSQLRQAGANLLGGIASTAAGVLGLILDYFTMLVVLFFLMRDSASLAATIRAISPLSEMQERHLVERFRVVSRATVIGNLITALSQGAAGSLIFLVLGLPNPILWGALTALLSLVPVVGTALVWVPWTAYLFSTGSTGRAVFFAVTQIALVGGVDNILRPLLIEGDMRLHTLFVFFSIIGGIAYFGMAGLFLGPLVFAIAAALLGFYREAS